MKKLVFFLFRFSPRLVFLAMIAGVVTGACNTGLLAVINRAIAVTPEGPKALIWAFVGLCILLPLTRIVAQIILSVLSQKVIFDMRMHLSRQILAAPLREIEKNGPNKILASITQDVMNISNALTLLPILCMHMTILISGIAYLLWLYWIAGLSVIAALLAGIGIFTLLATRAQRHFRSSREEQDTLFAHLRTLTDGTKELKLHYKRRNAFLRDLLELTAASFRRNNVIAGSYFAAAGSIGHLLFFVVIGLCIFLLPAMVPSINKEIITGYTLVLLYLIIPLEGLMSMGPLMGNAAIALGKVEDLGVSFEGFSQEKEAGEDPKPCWNWIEYDGITHSFHREKEDRAFKLGPIKLRFQAGEMVFLVGGNGSGKTTLAKLLLGLYIPEAGEIYLDGTRITDDNRDSFRQYFSAVFSDFYLFDRLLGLDPPEIDEKAQAYLTRLQLNHKVKIEGGILSTIELSQGQRKRLALLTAYLEDRPIYLFDEWAADQDPYFKEIFYLVLLPELKKRGKTVIVISHDDHYYHVADRIIKLDYGQLEYDQPMERALPQT